ncbi:MAG: hypothetical protein ABJG15_08235 [Hyphomonadaceae bacterium]
MKYALMAGLALSALAACGEQAAAPTATPTAGAAEEATTVAETVSPIDIALNGAWRSDANKARDGARNPAATLAFFGVDADETVVEISPGGGWYTEVIAPYLNAGGGKYIAATRGNAERDAAFIEKFGDADVFGTVNVGVLGGEGIADGSVDTVLTFRNIHNWMGGGTEAEVFANAYAALKPGGVFGVIEHRLPSSAEQDPQGGAGYVHQDYAIALGEAAGFELAGTSEINANPADTADHPFGVWTLPPASYGTRDGVELPEGFDNAKYVAIGESDRFTLKFVKPTTGAAIDHGADGS